MTCKKCGSKDFKKAGRQLRATGKYVQIWQCKQCGHYQQEKKER